jgi:hypothetical protein
MDKKTAIEFLGKTGEKIVANELVKEGLKVEHSINNFDSEKDFIVDGYKVEVKTEQPYVLKNCISIRKNQLKKCRSVDALFFVLVKPLMRPDYKWGGWLMRVDPNFQISETYTTKFGTEMISIPIEQESVIPLRKLTDEENFELLKYAQSAYSK